MAIAGIASGLVGLLLHIISAFWLPAEYGILSDIGLVLAYLGVVLGAFSIISNIDNIRMTRKNISKKAILSYVCITVCVFCVVLSYVLHK
jgi:hypothetical protein